MKSINDGWALRVSWWGYHTLNLNLRARIMSIIDLQDFPSEQEEL